jgi:hypothetical protein
MTAPTAQAQLGHIAPFFIVRNVMPDQLRGFYVMDADGNVLYFGRPV